MIAYRLPKASLPLEAAEHPSAKRLLPAGPWQYSAHPQGGTMMTWKDAGGVIPPLHSFAAPRETEDGLTYYGAKQQLTPQELARTSFPNGIVVQMSSGVSLSIAIALASARKLVFGAKAHSTGDYLTDYARLVEDVRDRAVRDDKIRFDDQDLLRCVLLAVQQTYRVTEELLTDLGWLSTDDFLPILRAAWGDASDPKA